jgi:hypothetical protein
MAELTVHLAASIEAFVIKMRASQRFASADIHLSIAPASNASNKKNL